MTAVVVVSRNLRSDLAWRSQVRLTWPVSTAGSASLDRASLTLRPTAPNTRILPSRDWRFQAGLNYVAATAYGLSFFDLEESEAGVPNREEKVRIFIQTGSAIAPGHLWLSWLEVLGSASSESVQVDASEMSLDRTGPTSKSTPRSTPKA